MTAHAPSVVLALVCSVVLVGAAPSAAGAQAIDQSAAPTEAASLSITPFVAMGDDLAPGAGGAFSFLVSRSFAVEVEASLGRDAARSSASLLYTLPGLADVVYVAGGLGIQRDEIDTDELWCPTCPPLPEHQQAQLLVSVPKQTEFAVNIGAGVTIPIRNGWSYRADFRWYNPKQEWPESWRVFSGIRFGLRR